MPVAWPDQFPQAERIGYGGSVDLPFVANQFQAARTRRRIYADLKHTISLQLKFKRDVLPFFWSWLKYDADEGAAEISMPVADGGTAGQPFRVTNIDGYIESPVIQYEYTTGFYVLTLQYRINELTTPSKADLDRYTGVRIQFFVTPDGDGLDVAGITGSLSVPR